MNRWLSVLIAALATLGCTDRGPAERAGAALDDAADRAGDVARDARDDAEDLADDVSDRLGSVGQ